MDSTEGFESMWMTWQQLSQIRGTNHRGHKVIESSKTLFTKKVKSHCKGQHYDRGNDHLHCRKASVGTSIRFWCQVLVELFHSSGISIKAMIVPIAKYTAIGTG